MLCGRIKGEDDGGWEGHGYARLEIFGGPKFKKNQEKQEKAGKTIEKPGKNEKPLRKQYVFIDFSKNM